MLTFKPCRLARKKKDRRRNSINRYSSTLKCGNDCRALYDRIFSTTLWNARHAWRRHKDGVIDIADFFESQGGRSKRGIACQGLPRDFKYFRIMRRLRRATQTYADTERAIIDTRVQKPLNYSAIDSA